MEIEINEDFINWNDYICKERANKYCASVVKKKEAQIVAQHCSNIKYKGKYPIKITFLKYFNSKRQDLDNTRVKGIIDGLVKCGVIENDNLTKIQEIKYLPIFTKEKIGLKLIIEEL